MSEKINNKSLLEAIDKKRQDAQKRREQIALSSGEMTPEESKIAWFSLLAREMAFDEIEQMLKR